MGDVKLNIAGRIYDVHCEDGQEQQLIGLAAIVDEKVRAMPGGTETRQLLFASLMLADEAIEAKGKLRRYIIQGSCPCPDPGPTYMAPT
ncbi:MAG: cell division protein ZapA [Sphingopyxis sp.]|nr:cell division protein ZapA [Sphingopyxis sp.]